MCCPPVLTSVFAEEKASNQNKPARPLEVDVSSLSATRQKYLADLQVYARFIRGSDLQVLNAYLDVPTSVAKDAEQVVRRALDRQVYFVARIQLGDSMAGKTRRITLAFNNPPWLRQKTLVIGPNWINRREPIYVVRQLVGASKARGGDSFISEPNEIKQLLESQPDLKVVRVEHK